MAAFAIFENSLSNAFNGISRSQQNNPTNESLANQVQSRVDDRSFCGKTWSEALTEEYDICCKYIYTELNIYIDSNTNEIKPV